MAIPLESYANALNLAEMQELCDQAQQKGEVIYQQTKSENRFNLPERFGRGGESEIHLRSGMTVIIRDVELWQSIKLENHYSQSPPLISKFHLSGNSRVLTPNIPDIKDDYMEMSGFNYLYHLPGVIEVLKGPSSILYGEIQPGGVINLVTKRPLSDPFYEHRR